ncbi:MAG TPA: amino acid adenylation domain-containing protein, partial [Pyrinomonadaceae bacterium]|nr:amino acid adenylation domain-containing protein [Pyrinomonadaceae bacterium]
MSTVTTETFDSNEILPEALTLVDLLRLRASSQPEQLAYTFLLDGEKEEANISYGELDRQARAIAASLQPLVSPGDRVLLLYPPGLEYIAAFFGCLYAGAIAVPAYPPRRNRNLLRLQSLVADAQSAVALTTGPVLARMAPLFSENPYLSPLRWLTSDGLAEGVENNWEEPILTGTDLAFLQYTSGSTSLPKGVMLSHGNLLHNERVIQSAFGQTAASVIMGWLPLYHDMGLIGNVIQPLFVGARCVLMSPAAFLQRPLRWLQAISRYRATTSGGPNFAYDLCARKVTEDERATLDLSSWRVAFNGSEPIRHETIENFARTFETCGFRREAFYPCYGLAEATLIVSGRRSEGAPVVKSFEACALENNLAVEAEAGVDGAKTLVGSGETLLEQEIVVVHPQTLARSVPGEVGEIWVSSPSIAHGYWNQPEQTERTFGARIAGTGEVTYLRTGDLGFFSDGELFVTGRLKDLIIIRGLNHYPQDIELTVERSHEALRAGCVAAFSVELEGEERLVVVQEADHRRQAEAGAICEAVVEAVAEAHEVQVYAVVLIRPGTIAKTSSGKIQRHACRAAFLESSLDVIGQLQTGVHAQGTATHAALPTLPVERSAGAIEEWLRSLLAANLGIEASRIDVNQSVARYGIDSLAAIELAHAVEASLGIVLPVTTFLQSPSIADITAGVLEQLEAPRPVREAARSLSHKTSGEHTLSHGQQALWFLHEMAPESAAYNIAGAARILSELDVAALRRAFQTLVGRHAVLRTTFHVVDGKPVQRVNDDSAVCFELEDYDASSGGAAGLPERLMESAGRPFDLRQGPPLRVNLFRGSDGEHVLLLSVHHIVADFWSLAVLAHELGALYEGELQGIPAKLAPLVLQYTDVVRWQEEALQSPEGEQHWDYWQQQLANEPAALNLPTDRPRPHMQTYRGASQSFELDAELTTRLKALSQEHGATLYMTLLAAFQTLLARYTQQTDIAVGSPTANRRWAEAAGLVGYFVNPVVMRGDLSGNPTFDALLARTRQTVLDAFKHQDFPFPLLVERLHPTRETSRSPLFQVQFILQKAQVRGGESLSAFAAGVAGARINLGALTLESLPLEQHVAQFDLTLSVAELNGRLAASFQYNTDLFDPETIERMSGHFRLLLESIVGDSRQSLSELAMLSEAERHRLLVEWNDTAADYPTGFCIHQLFEAQVERTPDAVAVIFGEQQLTYREINNRANQLAHHLIQLGVLPESRVGVLLERSAEMVISLLAIHKAGAAYLPLDPAYPQERLRFMLEDARASLLISQLSLSNLLTSSTAPLLLVDEDSPSISLRSTANPSSPVSAHNLAYLIYTSGSTGKPKGVAIEHLSACVLILWAHRSFSDAQLSGVLASTSICFDLSVFEIFVPLSCGGAVVVVQNALALSELGHFARSAVTLINTVPSVMTELLRLGAVPESVTVVNLAGEALSRKLVDEVYSLSRVAEVYNLYGPSEDTTYSTFTLVPPDSSSEPTIGRPIANTSAYVLDADLRLVAQGLAGQLYLSGSGLARGYLNRPDLTAASFLPDPFSSVPGSRLYRTGDLARRLSNGEIEYLGRIDQQVKVRGYRIELGEIEAALTRESAVEAAAVVVREEEGGEKRLVAYVVARAGEEIRERELRAGIKQSLPEYMVPSVFVTLEEMPLTANGKIDRKRLPAPEHVRPDTSLHHVGARTAVEEAISSIWAEVLKVPQVGVHDNFFELGGHSLLATQVMSRLREAFQVEMALRTMFEKPTVGELAVELEGALRAGAGVQAPPITRVNREHALPLSFAQQRLWFLDQLEPDSSFYNIPVAVRLGGQLDAAALESALTEIVRRHESLRTSFGTREGQPVQVVHEAWQVEIPVTDLSCLTEDEREAEAVRLAGIEARLPFNLSTAFLMRASLLRLSEEEHVVLLTMHHIISDGWSMGVLIREISLLYQAYSANQESPLEELAIQYADYAYWQREWLQGEILEEQLSYWRTQLGVRPAVLELLTDRPRPAIQTFRGAIHAFSLDKESTAKLKEAGSREGVTMFMLLLAAFQTLLYRYTGAKQINVGTPIANRTSVETEGLVGFFVNTLVLRADVDGKATFTELLLQVREAALGAYAHQDVPFEKLVEALQPERSLSHSPLFQVMFAWQNTPESDLQQVGELRMRAMGGESRTAKFDLTLSMSEAGEEIGATIEYNTDLFDASTIARMAGHFTTLLQSAAAQPSQRVSDLPLLTDGELNRLLRGWNDTATAYDARECLHQLFEAQAERTPAAVAVAFAGEQLTYGELNARANQLARHLRSLGVAPESLVGVCCERSIEMVVGLLGVLKAGGAYVPIDPTYPQARLAYVLSDTRTPVLLTQSALADAWSGHDVRVIRLDTDWPEIARRSAEAFDSGVTGDNLAYSIYTSGSTGQPKGAMNTHRAIRNRLLWMQGEYELTAADRVLQKTPFSFDVSVWEFFWPLMTGARLVMALPGGHQDSAYLVETIEREQITTLHFVPSMLQVFLEEKNLARCSSLRRVICSGEALPKETQERFFARLDAELHNLYGPTEAAVDVTSWACERNSGRSAVPIGRPVSNTEIYLLDSNMNLLPDGLAGELHIGGIQLARGYLNRPDLTAERFVPNPFSLPGERLYKTGDLARRLPGGEIEFLGRLDYQVKIRGFRIELGEIEAVLAQHASVAESVVLAKEDARGQKRLVAYVLAGESLPSAVELRAHLKEKLPEYMIPAAYVVLSEIPVTPNGKADRRALMNIDEAVGDESEQAYIAPRTVTEELLAGIWAEVLGVERVGVGDNFFDLGGHSLLATQVVSRVRENFMRELALREMFERPTVAALAERIETSAQAEAGTHAPPVRAVERDGRALPLSFGQQRLWFLNQLEPDSSLYNISGGVRLTGALDIGALERTLSEVVRRHEALRTTFAASEGEPVQVINDAHAVILPVNDLGGTPEAAREAEAIRLAREEAARPFDFERGPLMRTSLLKLADDEHVLLVTMHHIVSDGWSLGVLIKEVAALYESFVKGEESPLAELKVQYADYAAWQREWLQGEVLGNQLSYWKRQLDGASHVLELPTDRPRPPVQTYRGAHEKFELSESLTERLKSLSRREGVTLYMTLLAAFQTLLARYTAQEDILVGADIANRQRGETEELIGFFVNLLALRGDLSGDPTFTELLGRTREACLAAYAHQELPFEKLVEELDVKRDLSRAPLFQVLFVLQNAPMPPVELGGLVMTPLAADVSMSHFDLTLDVVEEEGVLRC